MAQRKPETEAYLGDGVYCKYDGYQFWLTTEGFDSTHAIALEPSTLAAFKAFVRVINATKTVEYIRDV